MGTKPQYLKFKKKIFKSIATTITAAATTTTTLTHTRAKKEKILVII